MVQTFSDTAIILAAGKGTRMGGDTPKVLLSVAEKPVLLHVVDFWKSQGVSKFIFVVGHKAEMLTTYIISQPDLSRARIVIQYEQRGIAHAILQAKPLAPERFIVCLGDCISIGTYELPAGLEMGYAVWNNPYSEALNRGCSVTITNNRISKIVEKPPVDFAGIGTYFFDSKVFPYIENAKPSALRNEIEITDVMDAMVKDGQPLKPVWFNGDFLNMTYPRDIAYAEKLLSIVC